MEQDVGGISKLNYQPEDRQDFATIPKG